MLGPWGRRAEDSPQAFNGFTSGYTALRLITVHVRTQFKESQALLLDQGGFRQEVNT